MLDGYRDERSPELATLGRLHALVEEEGRSQIWSVCEKILLHERNNGSFNARRHLRGDCGVRRDQRGACDGQLLGVFGLAEIWREQCKVADLGLRGERRPQLISVVIAGLEQCGEHWCSPDEGVVPDDPLAEANRREGPGLPRGPLLLQGGRLLRLLPRVPGTSVWVGGKTFIGVVVSRTGHSALRNLAVDAGLSAASAPPNGRALANQETARKTGMQSKPAAPLPEQIPTAARTIRHRSGTAVSRGHTDVSGICYSDECSFNDEGAPASPAGPRRNYIGPTAVTAKCVALRCTSD